jgi:hypothetical protein
LRTDLARRAAAKSATLASITMRYPSLGAARNSWRAMISRCTSEAPS